MQINQWPNASRDSEMVACCRVGIGLLWDALPPGFAPQIKPGSEISTTTVKLASVSTNATLLPPLAGMKMAFASIKADTPGVRRFSTWPLATYGLHFASLTRPRYMTIERHIQLQSHFGRSDADYSALLRHALLFVY